MKMIFALILCFMCVLTRADKFPSLLTTNATLAIVIDREFLGDEFDKIKDAIETYLVYAKRELLKHGGVNIQYYSWASINAKRDITALISVASCDDTWRIFNIAEDEYLLHMAISESDCTRLPQDQAITVPMIQKGQELPQIVLDLRVIGAYDWKSVVLLYDHTLTRDMVTRVVSAFTAESINLRITGAAVSLINLNTTAFAAENQQTIRNRLIGIDPRLVGNNFLAIVEWEMVEQLMEVAKSLNLVTTETQWLYVVSDTYEAINISSVKHLLREGDNVAFIYNTTINSKQCKSGLECHVEEMLEAFITSLDSAIVDENELSSQVSDEEWEEIRPTKMERRNFLLNSVKNQLLDHGTCNNCTKWHLQSGETWGKEYQKNSSQFLNDLIQVGNWRPSDGPALVDQLFPHVAHGFRGKTLPMISFHNPPWQLLKLNESGAVIEYGGLIFDVIRELAKNLNFTFTVTATQDYIPKVIGTSVPGTNGSTKGKAATKEAEMTADLLTNVIPTSVIDLIQSKTMALGACGFSVTEEYKSVINFTAPVSIQTYTFLAARPRELSRALLFMSPFTFDTWLCLAASVILMGPILYLIHRFSPVYEYRGIPQAGGLSSIENCLWYMYGALLQQGGMHLPYADSARLIVGTWWLVVLVVSTTYCGNLVAFLTFPKIDIPITTINELLEHRDTVTWSTVKGSVFEKIIKESKDAKYRNLYEGMMKDDIDPQNMVTDIEQGRHVYFDWKTRLHYYMKKQFLATDRCDLTLGSEDYFDEQIAMVVAKDTPYLKIIDKEIKRLHQVGLIEKWYKNYLPKKDKCFKVSRITQVTNHTVNMDDMQGSFFVLVIGFVLAALWLFSEKVLSYYHRQRKEKIRPFVS